jgi:thiosulfate/3-mercaptopyruvate sulfurtransferase
MPFEFLYCDKLEKMKVVKVLSLLLVLICSTKANAQSRINWTNDQLLEPSELAAVLKTNKTLPVIFSVGPGATIPGSKDIGMVKDAENLQKLKDSLANLPKESEIIIYCGCCPFERCPNARPAIQVLKDMNFTNYKLLNLPHNIKIDWIDKGYPSNN